MSFYIYKAIKRKLIKKSSS